MKKDIYNCLLCERELLPIERWESLVKRSWSQTICERCNNKFERYTSKTDGVEFLYHYNEAMKDCLHQYKFMHDVVLAKVFRNEIYASLANRSEIIVPIPMHSIKMQQRTFAHIDELLKAANIPFTHLLEKTTTENQVGKSKKERLRTPPLFTILKNGEIEPKDYIIVDDIYTTGTTIQHAQQALLKAGAKSVKAFVLIKG